MTAKKDRPDKNKAHVVAYLRVSTNEQAEEGYGMESQLRAIKAYCEYHGLEIVETIEDPGVSASKPLAKRPGGSDLLDIIDNSTAGGVVVMKLDRLFRDTVDCLTTVRGWGSAGVGLHLVDFGGANMSTDSPAGVFFLTMAAGFAEMERRMIAERTRAAMATMRAKGLQVGRVPYGYDVGPGGQLVGVETELATLSRIRDMRGAGASLRAVVDALEADSVPPPQARHGGLQGIRWYPSTISRILNRPDPAAQDAPS